MIQDLSIQNAAPVKLPHVFLGLCSHDSRVHVRFLSSIMKLVGCGAFKLSLSSVSSGGVHKARNQLAWEFMTQSDAEWYFSVDSDIEFLPEHLQKLMSRNLGVVGGMYCHKNGETKWCARTILGKEVDPQTGLQEVNATGTGFLLVKREVFEKIRETQPEIAHTEDWNMSRGVTKWDFFSEGIVQDPVYYPERTLLSEDFYFCKRARDAGYPVYTDMTFYLTHWDGLRGYPEKAPPTQQLAGNPAATPANI